MSEPARTILLAWCAVGAAVLLVACTEPERDAARSLRSVLGSADGTPAGFARADRIRDFVFPADHGPHPAYRSEWWYLTAVVSAAGTATQPAAREFGVQFTLFRQGFEARAGEIPVPNNGPEAWRTGQGYMAHVALSDIRARRHLAAERFSRGHPALAGARAEPFRVYLDDWQLASTGGTFSPLRLTVNTADFSADLLLTAKRPAILQGDGGLSRKGPGNASYYYSVPRLEAQGELVVGGSSHAVNGLAWIDREWSTSVLGDAYQGWDWFALHLDDGRDLMLYQLRRLDGQTDAYNAGSLGNGAVSRTLTAGDFSLNPIEHWRGWPVAWQLVIRGAEPQQYVIRAAINDQVMHTAVRYWEGVVHLEDDEGRRRGAGYMELTGY
ncbi:MAG: carotenoid 1,2-hydratase [Gammaproteobacteria bacterium]|nr:carotenoid 1,2-hydratase [Gammaproteobacteria bacterium]